MGGPGRGNADLLQSAGQRGEIRRLRLDPDHLHREKEGKVYTTIQNLGATIPPEELPLLFDRFHKTDASRSEDRDGVGLGLYIVKSLIGNLKEQITATSEDGVTRFTFSLTSA